VSTGSSNSSAERAAEHRTGALSVFAGRVVMVIAAIVAFAAAGAVWALSTHTEKTMTRTTVTSELRARTGRHGSRTGPFIPVASRVSVTEGSADRNADGEQPLIVGLLALAGGLLLACVFLPRITELSLLGVTLKLAPALREALRDVSDVAGDPQRAGDAVADFLVDLAKVFAQKRDLSESDIEGAKERTLDKLGRIEDSIVLTQTGQDTRVEIDTPSEQPWVSTHEQLLPISEFDATIARRIATASAQLGRRLYAIDRQSGRVLAALSFQIRDGAPGAPRVVISAFATSRDQAAGGLPATFLSTLLAYARGVSSKLGGAAAALIRFDGEPPPELRELLREMGVRPSGEPGPSGEVYWISEGRDTPIASTAR
jgi:hypothetical protein